MVIPAKIVPVRKKPIYLAQSIQNPEWCLYTVPFIAHLTTMDDMIAASVLNAQKRRKLEKNIGMTKYL